MWTGCHLMRRQWSVALRDPINAVAFVYLLFPGRSDRPDAKQNQSTKQRHNILMDML
jgi:hypothetical protein